MKAAANANKTDRKPRLEITKSIEYEPGTGIRVKVTRTQRGALISESRTYNEFGNWIHQLCESPREILERTCNGIRDRLEEDGIPTDRHPKWAQKPEGGWVEYKDEDEVDPHAHRLNWYARAKILTEELTIERAAVEHLWWVIQLLNRKGIEEHLWNINRAMQTFASLKLCAVNETAADGIAARKARAIGPQAKKLRATEIREVIRRHTNACWATNAILRRDATNTASRIAVEVNQELRDRHLLPHGRTELKPKTIADHIRATLRG